MLFRCTSDERRRRLASTTTMAQADSRHTDLRGRCRGHLDAPVRARLAIWVPRRWLAGQWGEDGQRDSCGDQRRGRGAGWGPAASAAAAWAVITALAVARSPGYGWVGDDWESEPSAAMTWLANGCQHRLTSVGRRPCRQGTNDPVPALP